MTTGTVAAVLTCVLWFAGTLASLELTDTANRSVQVTVARLTLRKPGEAMRAFLAVWLLEVAFAETLASSFGAGTVVQSRIALTGNTHVLGFERPICRTIEAVLASIAVDSFRVVAAVETHASTVEIQFCIQ